LAFLKVILVAALTNAMHNNAHSQSIAALDNNNGFKHFKFGMHKSSFGERQFYTVENGGAERCVITGIESIGDIKVKDVELYFVEGYLAKIIVNIPYGSSLFDACVSAFGQPSRPCFRSDYVEGETRECEWIGNKVKLHFYYGYNYNFNSKSIGDSYSTRAYLRYELVNYDKMRDAARSKYYSPSKL
jgi:hypothetical protein